MPRASRKDEPGAWHHVTARGIAKRTIFERREDHRMFLSLVAREVRRGEIEVHAYSLMQTHLHMLVRSPRARLSAAMARILREYARWFNRRRKRDGGLFKERFKSKRVESDAYRSILVRYIDDNPVKAKMAPFAAAYPFGSASIYALDAGPIWVCRDWIESEVREVSGGKAYDPKDYLRRFPSKVPDALRHWVEWQIAHSHDRDAEFDELLAPHSDATLDWMVRKALLADGTEPFQFALPAAFLDEEWEIAREEQPDWPWEAAREREGLWPMIRVGLARHGAGLSFREIRSRTDVPESTAFARADRYRQLLKSEPEVTARVAIILARVHRRVAREAFPHRTPSEQATN